MCFEYPPFVRYGNDGCTAMLQNTIQFAQGLCIASRMFDHFNTRQKISLIIRKRNTLSIVFYNVIFFCGGIIIATTEFATKFFQTLALHIDRKPAFEVLCKEY